MVCCIAPLLVPEREPLLQTLSCPIQCWTRRPTVLFEFPQLVGNLACQADANVTGLMIGMPNSDLVNEVAGAATGTASRALNKGQAWS